MSCIDPRRWQPKIALEVGGELPPDERPAVTAHLETCPSCRALAEELAADRQDLAELAAVEPPPEALDRVRRAVLAAVREAEDGERSRPLSGPLGWSRARRMVPALAAALFALAVGLALWLPHSADRPPAIPPAPEDPATGGEGSAPEPEAASLAAAPSESSHPAPAGGTATARQAADRLASARPIPDPEPSRPQPSGPEPSRPLGAAPIAADPADGADRAEPAVTIQIVSEDPDIVFYWITDQPQEESDDATV